MLIGRQRAGCIVRGMAASNRRSFGLQTDRAWIAPRATVDEASICEDRAPGNRCPGTHALADRAGWRKGAGPARMTGNQPDPPRTGRAEMACGSMPAGCKAFGRPAMRRVIAIAACRPRRMAIVHFSTPFRSDPCFGNRTMPALRRSDDDGPCRAARGRVAALPPGHPRGLRPCRPSPASLRNRPDATSSTFAWSYSQGAGQLRARPSAQGFHRTGTEPERAARAGSCETETRAARAASAVQRQRIAAQGVRTIRKILPARVSHSGPRLPAGFTRAPTRNVSRPLHGCGHPRAAGRARFAAAIQPTR